MKISILIADSQQLVREGLRAILASQSDFEVIADVADGLSAVTMVRKNQPEVAIIEAQLPRLSGIAAVRQIRFSLSDLSEAWATRATVRNQGVFE